MFDILDFWKNMEIFLNIQCTVFSKFLNKFINDI